MGHLRGYLIGTTVVVLSCGRIGYDEITPGFDDLRLDGSLGRGGQTGSAGSGGSLHDASAGPGTGGVIGMCGTSGAGGAIGAGGATGAGGAIGVGGAIGAGGAIGVGGAIGGGGAASSGGAAGAGGSIGSGGAAGAGGTSGAGGAGGGSTGGAVGTGGAGIACGNGSVEAGEQCDTSGASATCDADCTFAVCGDGAVSPLAGETCDLSGGQSSTCDHACRAPLAASCPVVSRLGHRYSFCTSGLDWVSAQAVCTASRGNLVRIDDGGESSWLKQHASANSLSSYWLGVNDRVVSRQYVWADGQPLGSGFSKWALNHPWSGARCGNANNVSEWLTRDCATAYDYVCENYRPTPLTCGNGTVEPSEACDGGGETPGCDVDCTTSRCGDGVLNRAAGEQCDDGEDPGGCPANCQSPPLTGTAVVIYDFDEGAGVTVTDTGGGAATNLTILTPGAVTWVPGGLTLAAGAQIRSTGSATEILSACGSSGAYTLEAWFVPDPTLLAGDNGWRHIVSLSTAATDVNAAMYQDGRATGLISRTSTTTADGLPSMESNLMLHPGVNHVAITRAASGAEIIYVDDALVTNRTLTGNLATWNQTSGLWVGSLAGTAGSDWSGTLLRVAVYCRALTAAELLTNYYSVP